MMQNIMMLWTKKCRDLFCDKKHYYHPYHVQINEPNGLMFYGVFNTKITHTKINNRARMYIKTTSHEILMIVGSWFL